MNVIKAAVSEIGLFTLIIACNFNIIKHNKNFKRFLLNGINTTEIEWGLFASHIILGNRRLKERTGLFLITQLFQSIYMSITQGPLLATKIVTKIKEAAF